MNEAVAQPAIQPNTEKHEQAIALVCKGVVAGVMDLMVDVLNQANQRLQANGQNDPLSVERYVHVAEKLSGIACAMYDLGERSRSISKAIQPGEGK